MIDKRGKRWRVIVYVGRDPITGRKRQKSLSVATRAEAKQAEARLITKVGAGQHCATWTTPGRRQTRAVHGATDGCGLVKPALAPRRHVEPLAGRLVGWDLGACLVETFGPSGRASARACC